MASLSGLFAATISLAAYILIIGSGSAVAQGASPPPAVSVVAVASRQVTETASFVGRVVAIDKVDVIARVSGFINERNFTEGQQVKTAICFSASNRIPTRQRSTSKPPILPGRKRQR